MEFWKSSLVPGSVGFHDPVHTHALSGAPARPSMTKNLLCINPSPPLIGSNRSVIRGIPLDEIELKAALLLSYSQTTRTLTPRFLALISALAIVVPGVPLRL